MSQSWTTKDLNTLSCPPRTIVLQQKLVIMRASSFAQLLYQHETNVSLPKTAITLRQFGGSGFEFEVEI